MTASMWWAIQLSPTVDVCRRLLAGDHVEESELDPKVLARAKAIRAVRLDRAAIDLFANSLDEEAAA